MAIAPEHFSRRSFVYPALVRAGAEFAQVHGAAVATSFPGTPDPALGLVDLSPLVRTGIRGSRVPDWMRERGWPFPETPNIAARTNSGATVLRLGSTELIVLSAPRGDGTDVAALEAEIPGDGVWHLPRRESYFWFLLRGAVAVDCLHKLCGVDLRPAHFAPGAIAQTSVARVNTIVVRAYDEQTPSFHLLADSASAAWFWDAMLDAMNEFGGGPLGLHALPEQL